MKRNIRCLLVAPLANAQGYSGEDAYTESLLSHPPEGVDYVFHEDLIAAGRARRVKWVHTLFGLLGQDHLNLIPYTWLESFTSSCDFDIIHVHAWQVFFGRQMRRRNTPIVLSSSSAPTYGLKAYLGWSNQRVTRHALASTALLKGLGVQDSYFNPAQAQRIPLWSEFARADYLAAGIPDSRLVVVPPGLPDPGKRATPGKRRIFQILFVGNDFERKGGHELLGAFAKLREKYGAKVHLNVVSSGFSKAESDSGVASLGRLDRCRVLALYPECDIFVLPSHAEGYGMSLVEAMSFGLPVVVSDAGALPSLVNDQIGFVVRNEQQLCDALDALVQNPVRCAQMGERAYEHFRRQFDVRVTNELLRGVYEDAIEPARAELRTPSHA